MVNERKYEFDWSLVGSTSEETRPLLGNTTSIEVYRLFQYSLRDILEQRFGTKVTDDILREAGVVAGKAFFREFCGKAKDINELIKAIQDSFKILKIGVFRVENSDKDNLAFTVTIDEDLDCSGLPDTNDQTCVYDEGLLQGIFESYTGNDFHVREVDCWSTGSRTCRFKATRTELDIDE